MWFYKSSIENTSVQNDYQKAYVSIRSSPPAIICLLDWGIDRGEGVLDVLHELAGSQGYQINNLFRNCISFTFYTVGHRDDGGRVYRRVTIGA